MNLASVTALFCLIATRAPACTIFVLTDTNRTLFCNNEDWSDPKTRIWFVPGNDKHYGGVYVGFDNDYAQGGLNTEGLAFDWLGKLHPRFETPHRALVLQTIWSCALVATGTYRALFTRVIYTEWIFFALMSVGLMRLRKRVSFVPVVFAAAALLVAAIQIQADAGQAATGLLLVVAGLPVYWWKKRAA